MASTSARIRLIQVAFGLGIATLVGRAAQLQLVEGARHAATARAQRTERMILPARRGGIFDRSGAPLASTQESFHVGVAPNELRDRSRDAREIATRLGLSRRDIDRALRRRYAYFHGPFSSARVEPLRRMPGVHLSSEFVRFYPDRDLARPILGRPGSDGKPADGLERVFDSLLAGRPGSAVVLRDGKGRRYESPSRLDAFPVPGLDVYLTIDADLQDIVERALTDAIERFEAAGGDIVVLDPDNGEILAVASRRSGGATSPTAFTSVFEPGSTAKPLAAAVMLTLGRVRLSDSVWGEHGKYLVPYRKAPIEDDHPGAWMTLRQVIAASSNIGIVKFADRLAPTEQYEGLRDFGLGTGTGVEFPSESPGRLPLPHQWSGTTADALAMGYEISLTPIQLAQAYGAIANDGVMLQPTLVREIRTADGRTTYRHVPEPVRRVISPAVAVQLREMLRGVVYEGGTGSTAALRTDDIAGKTGTARKAGPGGYIAGAYTANFASMFPAGRPQLVMVVKLDDPRGGYARLSAAPVTRTVLEQLLAARTGAIDRTRLAGTRTAPGPDPVLDAGTIPYVVSWPPKPEAASSGSKTVPDVGGLSVRAAARQLHRLGLSVQLRGWGRVVRTDPVSKSLIEPGAVVLLMAQPIGAVTERSPAASPSRPRKASRPAPSKARGR